MDCTTQTTLIRLTNFLSPCIRAVFPIHWYSPWCFCHIFTCSTPPAPGFLFLIHTLRTPHTADAALMSPSISHMAIGISTPPLFMSNNGLQGPKYKNTQKPIHTQFLGSFHILLQDVNIKHHKIGALVVIFSRWTPRLAVRIPCNPPAFLWILMNL